MKKTYTLLFLLLLILPFGAIFWLALRVAHEGRAVILQQQQQLARTVLEGIDQQAQDYLTNLQAGLIKQSATMAVNAEALRLFVRQNSMVKNLLVLSKDRQRIFPPIETSLQERDFVKRIQPILGDFNTNTREETQNSAKGSWHVEFWEKGLDLFLYHYDGIGRLWVLEIERIMVIADLMRVLGNSELPKGVQVAFKDELGQTIALWGTRQKPGPLATSLSLNYPLSAWKLEYFYPAFDPVQQLQKYAQRTLILLLTALSAAVLALALLFYRSSKRVFREALQKVSFVNQVSHELKTPLTNICLYAELLEQDLEEADEQIRQRLFVINSESQRLSRLIKNVLWFSQKKVSPTLVLAKGNLTLLLEETLKDFSPSFLKKGITSQLESRLPEPLQFSADVVEQIVTNLLSNVEKYAPLGEKVVITAWQEGDNSFIQVLDHGPGIPYALREKIFEPFYRVSNQLTDGVTGTGIGLTLARKLAKLHQGDLSLQPSAATGACFIIKIRTVWE